MGMVIEGNGEVAETESFLETSLLLDKMSPAQQPVTPDLTTEGVEQGGVWSVAGEVEGGRVGWGVGDCREEMIWTNTCCE